MATKAPDDPYIKIVLEIKMVIEINQKKPPKITAVSNKIKTVELGSGYLAALRKPMGFPPAVPVVIYCVTRQRKYQ